MRKSLLVIALVLLAAATAPSQTTEPMAAVRHLNVNGGR